MLGASADLGPAGQQQCAAPWTGIFCFAHLGTCSRAAFVSLLKPNDLSCMEEHKKPSAVFLSRKDGRRQQSISHHLSVCQCALVSAPCERGKLHSQVGQMRPAPTQTECTANATPPFPSQFARL